MSVKNTIAKGTLIEIVTNDKNPSRADVISAFDRSVVLNFTSNAHGTITLMPNQIAWEDGSRTGFMLYGYGEIQGVPYRLMAYYRPGNDQQIGTITVGDSY